mmetsp:Transcript_32474/g.64733  ORF Transcript_32474/g.64733 Transcript_32474/m.64733 type:complete len:383 (-) Transcript_32474:206-1354(-)
MRNENSAANKKVYDPVSAMCTPKVLERSTYSCRQGARGCVWRFSFLKRERAPARAHPHVLLRLESSQPPLWVDRQQSAHESLGVVGDRIPPRREELIGALGNLLLEPGTDARSPRREAAQHRVQHDSASPQIRGCAATSLPSKLLGRHVLRRAHPFGSSILLCQNDCREAKVDQAYRGHEGRFTCHLLEADILRLHIPVSNAALVQVSECREKLRHKDRSFLLRESAVRHKPCEELPACHVLLYEDALPTLGQYQLFIQGDDVGVMQRFHQLHFCIDRRQAGVRLHLGNVNQLDGHLLWKAVPCRLQIMRPVHHSIAAPAEHLVQTVATHQLDRATLPNNNVDGGTAKRLPCRRCHRHDLVEARSRLPSRGRRRARRRKCGR